MADRKPWPAHLLQSRSGGLGAAIVFALVAFAMLGPLLARHGPLESDFVHGISARNTPVGPCALFPLGADRLFRDVLARLAYAGRLSLLVSLSATAIATVVGAAVGILAGWVQGRPARVPWPALLSAVGAAVAWGFVRPGWTALLLAAGIIALAAGRFGGPLVDVDGFLMRLVDVLLAFPFLLLVMAIGAAIDRTSAVTVFVTLGVTGWLGTARVLRAKTLQVRSLDYILAARALGQSTAWILVKHVLPNIAGTLIVSATTQVAFMILADSVLSYLGVGISPPAPTWGRMLFEGQDDYATAPWLVLAPAAAIVLAVWGFNMLGEGLRDALDPRKV